MGTPRRARQQRRHRPRRRHLEHGGVRLRRGHAGARARHLVAVPSRGEALAVRVRRAARRSPDASSTPSRARASSATSARPTTPPRRRPSPASRRRCRSSCTGWASPSTPSARPAATRITGTMPNAPKVIEPDDIGDDEWNPMDPAVSSPVVAWLASDESQMVTGQVIRAVAENIILMDGWTDGADHQQRRQALGRHQARPATRDRHLQDAGAGPALLIAVGPGQRVRGKPRPRSAMMPRCTSLEPP